MSDSWSTVRSGSTLVSVGAAPAGRLWATRLGITNGSTSLDSPTRTLADPGCKTTILDPILASSSSSSSSSLSSKSNPCELILLTMFWDSCFFSSSACFLASRACNSRCRISRIIMICSSFLR
ncbi:hypothetical protein OGAPHI_001387 [Ogataea philodendri]|uniref:Uncharacterized protein n=1 Tax=Ogataea philodendri TaxID=1378263 RepID=A0A9P8PCH2_9ASCO|nr:uncharacterized protein OGAPHI_001387 [Ogataea philodendri]KAH3669266.1 hypothetical protein OGAPHI_001387 [Ogataea philodendri]